MAKVIITNNLLKEIDKKFKSESNIILNNLKSLDDNPKEGKEIGIVGGIVLKEIKYKGYRIYFITDKFKVKFLKAEELTDLLIKFVRMSDKKSQQKVIDEIKIVLRKLGDEGF